MSYKPLSTIRMSWAPKLRLRDGSASLRTLCALAGLLQFVRAS